MIHFFLVFCLGTACLALASEHDSLPQGGQEVWSKAGQEIYEAAHAVSDTGKESWNSTKEHSVKMWQSTNETAQKE